MSTPEGGRASTAAPGSSPTRPLHIGFLNSWYADRVRGSGTAAAIETFADGLRTRGHEVEALGFGHSRLPLPFLADRLRYNLRAPGQLSGRDDLDLVIGFDADGVALAERPRPFPYLVALKGVAADEARFESGWPHLLLSGLGVIERRNALGADGVIVPSRYSAGVVAERYGVPEERISLVPEAIDPAPWRALRAAPPPDRDPRPTVLTVGRQYPRKNTARLVRAMRVVRSRIPEARLRIVGGGPCMAALRELADAQGLRHAVDFAGAIPSTAEVRRGFFQADVFAMPSLQEGFGIVFLEAMAAGLPVVAGRAGAAPEVVRDGVTAVLVDPTSPEEIGEAIAELLEDGERAGEMGRAGVERSEEFTPEATARALEAVIRL